MFGYSRQELYGENPRKLKSGEHAKEMFTELWRSILSRTSWEGELVNKRKDGSLLDVSLTISPIVDARGQLTHFVGIYRDISERKQMERQLFQAQKMQSVGTLAGGIAHEFNNLLAGISGYASLGLRDAAVPPAVHEFLAKIAQLSERAANLTKQLLAFARRPTLSRQALSMAKLFRATAELVKRSLSIEIEVHIEAGKMAEDDLVALADGNQLQQVLVNLALNARDALKEPSPIIFRLRPQTLTGDMPAFPQSVPAGDYVVLEVEDRGSGMSPEVLHQALDPFFTTKEIGHGTGLGLPVAFGIVHAHQGFLTIRTRLDKGSCVSLYFPRLATTPAIETSDQGEILEPEPVPGRSILVIDDEEAVLDIIRRFLEIAGHKVIGAMNTAAALEVLANGSSVDLIIMDLMIPGEQGHQSFRAIRKQCARTPILLCTGLLQTGEAPVLLNEGAVDVLRKPFKMTELWNAVSKAFNPLAV
jgi:PAS domain S-box-containing protein